MFAANAKVVVQDTRINHFTQFGSGDTDSCSANEASENCARNAADSRTCGTSNNSDGHTESATGQGSADAGEATRQGANCATGPAAEISRCDVCGTTLGTLNAHVNAFCREEMTDAPLPAIPKGTGIEKCGTKPSAAQRDWTVWSDYSEVMEESDLQNADL